MISPEIYISPDSIGIRDIVRVILHKTIEVDESIKVYDDNTVYTDDPSEDEQPFSKSTYPDALDIAESAPTIPADKKPDNILSIGIVTSPTILPLWPDGHWR